MRSFSFCHNVFIRRRRRLQICNIENHLRYVILFDLLLKTAFANSVICSCSLILVCYMYARYSCINVFLRGFCENVLKYQW